MQCVVIGLQSTGEASTDAVLKLRGTGGGGGVSSGGGDDDKSGETTSTDYISAPQQTLLRVIERCFPLPPRPRAVREQDRKDDQEEQAVSLSCVQGPWSVVWLVGW